MKFTTYKTCNVKKSTRPKKGVSKVLTSILKKKKDLFSKFEIIMGKHTGNFIT